jgi:hypothetical protein
LQAAIVDGRVAPVGRPALDAHLPLDLPDLQRFGPAAVRRKAVV